MKWPLALLFSALLSAGCNGPQYNFDPFLGRTRVIPPGTGQVVPPTVQPYYRGSPTPAAPPSTTPAPPAGSGSYNFRQSSARPSNGTAAPMIRARRGVVNLDDQVDTAWSRPKGPWVTDRSTTVRNTTVRNTTVAAGQNDQKKEESAVMQASSERPVANAENEQPAPKAQNQQRPSSLQAVHFSTVSAPRRLTLPRGVGPIRRQTADKAATGRPPAKYGYDTDYHWLKGRLEYLESHRQWKLRYIPIDGETDRYGGSVVLADASAVADYQPGDFVAVEGTVNKPSGSSRSFAPTYLVERIKPALN